MVKMIISDSCQFTRILIQLLIQFEVFPDDPSLSEKIVLTNKIP